MAALLHLLPLCRLAVLSPATVSSPLAIVSAWVAGAVVLLGGYDSVSGASASIAGLVKYVGTTPVGSPTFLVTEPVGQLFKYRITVSNPGVDVAKNYFDCVPLPPGLTINTNPGAAGYITGTPTTAGAYHVTLVAGNLNYATPVTALATIVLYTPNMAPLITNAPASRSVLAGDKVTFSVGADGSLPMFCQWLRNGAELGGRTAFSLALTNVTTDLAGDYQAVLTNAFGSVTSTVARLTVREPFRIDLRLGQASVVSNSFHFVATGPIYTNYVVWRSSDLRAWLPIKTNWVIDGYFEFTDPEGFPDLDRFYRVTLSP